MAVLFDHRRVLPLMAADSVKADKYRLERSNIISGLSFTATVDMRLRRKHPLAGHARSETGRTIFPCKAEVNGRRALACVFS